MCSSFGVTGTVTGIDDNKSPQISCDTQLTLDDLIVHIKHLSRLYNVDHQTDINEYFDSKLSLTDHIKYLYKFPAMRLGIVH